MLRITAVGANAVDYLVRGSGCAHEQTPEVGIDHDSTEYYLSATGHGEAPGRWMGKGVSMLGVRSGERVDEDTVRAVFGRLEHPETGDPLGRRPGNYKDFETRLAAALEKEPDATPDRQREIADNIRGNGQQAVAYYDWTFSPPKTFSTQYAALLEAGRLDEAATMLRVQREAVAIAMDYAEEHASYTRTGYHGRTVNGRSVGKYEASDGFLMTVWDHSTNRESEPQIHTHVGVLNRTVTSSDDKIRALDGKAFRPIKEAAATAYERAVEDLSKQYLGYEWVMRPDGKAREIAGADLDLARKASTRREQVEERVGELVEAYVDRHGFEPSPSALKKMHQAATLDTRKPKSGEAGPAAVKAWAEQHRGALLAQLDSVAEASSQIALSGHPDLRVLPDQADRELIQRRAVAEVQRQYSTWSVGNLVAAIDRQLLDVPGTAANRPKVLEAMAREVLQPGNRFGVLSLTAPDLVDVPAVLRRKEDGRSQYRPHIDEIYATEEHLSTERRIVAGAAQQTAPRIEGPELELLRTEVSAIRIGDQPIGQDQVQAILGIASSGRAGDQLIGPAGAGKSTVIGVVAKVWEDRFHGRVMGLATSQRATQVLTDEGLEAINTTQFLTRFSPDSDGVAQDYIRAGDLIVVDEAGMSGTYELARISGLVEAGGGKLLYTGDQHQLAAIGAGGMLDLLAKDNGAFVLDEVHRFRDAHGEPNPWEGPASLRLREGDQAVLSEYEDRGRLRGGTLEEMQDAAMRAYLADTVAGMDSLLIVGTNDEAADLSRSIREELIALGRVGEEPISRLKDETALSVGDVIQARRNDWSIEVEGPGLVTNRLTYTVLGRDDRGRLLVEDSKGVKAHLPESYVREHVTLAYASTVHAAQGRTVDTSHALLGERSMREDAYVALTRGRQRNTAYLTTERQPDAHEHALDVTPAERMAAVMERSGADTAAELEYRVSQEEGRSLAWIGTQWDLVAKEYSQDRYTDVLAGLMGEDRMDALVGEEAYPSLMRAVRSAELAGHSPEALLAEVVRARELGTADSVSAVLRHRLHRQLDGRAPEQQVDGRNWTTFAAPIDGPVGQFMHSLAVASSDRQAELAAQTAAEMPPWAEQYLGEVPDQAEQRVEWLHRAGVAAAYRELHAIPADQVSLGPAPSPEHEFHRALWRQAHRALGNPADALDYQGASEAELRAKREQWQREQNWAPPFVAEELRQANELSQDYHQDAALFAARLETMEPGTAEHARAQVEIERAERMSQDWAERARQLDEVHRARQSWYAGTEAARVADQLAAEELERRALPLHPAPAPQPQQGELFAVVDDAEFGPAPERDVEPAPRSWELDPVNQPAVESEPVEHVRWWQRWADQLRDTTEHQVDVDPNPNQIPLFDVTPTTPTEADRSAAAPVVEEHQAAVVDPAQMPLFDVRPPVEVGRTWDFSAPQLSLFDVDHAPVDATVVEIEQDQAADVEPDPNQLVLFETGEHVEPEQVEPEAAVTATPIASVVEVDQAQDRAVEVDPDQLEMFPVQESVEHRVQRQPLRGVAPEPVDLDEVVQIQDEPAQSLEDRVTLAEARRQARAAEAQRVRREAANSVREVRTERVVEAERTAEKETAERARRDSGMDPTPETGKTPDRAAEKEREVDEPSIERVPQAAQQGRDPRATADRVARDLKQQGLDRDYNDWSRRSGPHQGPSRGPGLGR